MFTYNKTTNVVKKDHETIGSFNEETGVATLLVKLAPTHKSTLKKELEEAGLKFVKFEQFEGEQEDDETSEVAVLPPMPPVDPRYGDKTPELVAWYRENDPKEFERRYAGRVTA